MARLHKTSVTTTGLRTYVLSLHSPMVSLKKKNSLCTDVPPPSEKNLFSRFFSEGGGTSCTQARKKESESLIKYYIKVTCALK